MKAMNANRAKQNRNEVTGKDRSPERPQRLVHADAEIDTLDLQQLAGNHATGALLQGAPPNDELPDQVSDVLRTPGQPLDSATRTEMESRFGDNFSDVAIHTDSQAQMSAHAVRATAYTVGKDIVFGTNRYLPDTAPGKYLLAHELAHVVQQRRGGPAPKLDSNAAHEQDARGAASAVAHGEPSVSVGQATGIGLSRNDDDPDKPMTPAHAGGEMGERDAAFDLGQKGYVVVIGPGGEKGHKLTTPGFDIVAYHPKTGELRIVDNKASGGTSTVQDASAIIKNLKTNLGDAIQRIQDLEDFPNKADVLKKLESARAAIDAGKKLPSDVKLVITNAGGFHSGISKKLKEKGILFEDVTGKAVRDARKKDIKQAKAAGVNPGRPTTHSDVGKDPVPAKPGEKTAKPVKTGTAPQGGGQGAKTKGAVRTQHARNTDFQTGGSVIHTDRSGNRIRSSGPSIRSTGRAPRFRAKGAGLAEFLPNAMSALQDKIIRHRVASDMLSQWSKIEGWRRQYPNHVIISMVSLQEWEHPDPAGQVARAVNYVEFSHGETVEEVEAQSGNLLRRGVPTGWREVGPFVGVIQPTDDLSELKSHVESQECFIATACYQSPYAPEVRLLRAYRDAVLRHSWQGRLFIELYYAISPPIARFLRQHAYARHFVRTIILTPIVARVSRSAKKWSESK